jgi:hypothetical protein
MVDQEAIRARQVYVAGASMLHLADDKIARQVDVEMWD